MNSKGSNPTLIGIFVLGAGFLTALTVIFVGSFQLFSKQTTYVIYFDESVNGLSVGAAVKFKGVPVGRVADIRVRYNQDPLSTAIPVFIRLDPPRLFNLFTEDVDVASPEFFQQEVDRGLRGRLQLESIVTGQLYVELDYIHPSDEERPIFWQLQPLYLEIPSVPSVMARIGAETTDFVARIAAIDFKELSEELLGLVRVSRQRIEPLDTVALQERASAVLTALEDGFDPVRMDALFDQAAALMLSLQETSDVGRAELSQLVAQFTEMSQSIAVLSEPALQSLSQLQAILHPSSPLRRDVDSALRGLNRMARSFSELAELLERDPAALLRGRNPTDQPE